MTNQEMFDKAWNGLKSQGWSVCKEYSGYGSFLCMYNGSSGNHCAVGWIVDVPNELNHGGLLDLEEAGILDWNDIPFVSRLQEAHDGARLDMEDRFRRVAQEFNLKIPE